MFWMCVPQLELQLALKDNDLTREAKAYLNLKKALEREQQQSAELRAQIDTSKNVNSTLQRNIKELQASIHDQKVRVKPGGHIFL